LIFGYIFFNETISVSKVIGCIIILISCLLIVLKDTDRMKMWEKYIYHRMHTI
jgi:drug/metabolite transporter (DMT)-like permease